VKDKRVIIKVDDLTKRFSSGTALRGISFQVERGEMLGLLGPNGAGKTTTLRILAGYLAATEGSVRIDGLDVLEHSFEVRKRIGYLPENVPLYQEMRVDEYLNFRGRLKGMKTKRLRNRMDEVKSQCGLHEVSSRIIAHLSRGYHQRIGLADALLHEPELLLLDEPTIGLDPNQIRAIRDLVKVLGQKHTLVLSTHFLSEAEMLCERVLILNHGKIAASDSPAVLTGLMKNKIMIVAEIAGPHAEVAAVLQGLPGVTGMFWNPCPQAQDDRMGQEWNRYALECDAEADVRNGVFEASSRRGWGLRELKQERRKFEDAFAEITGDARTG
jgi:ABC-2 type transport system ATP-binding protein